MGDLLYLRDHHHLIISTLIIIIILTQIVKAVKIKDLKVKTGTIASQTNLSRNHLLW